jgi:hypothetical protein
LNHPADTIKHKAIGGYFELELPPANTTPYPDALRFQSARAAFLSLLREGRPRRIWAPKYICDSMLAPLLVEHVPICFYGIEENLSISTAVDLKEGDWLLFVNYFGICSEVENALLQRFNPDQVILDHAQAFFAPRRHCVANLYSPRKFFGVPDGGLMISQLVKSEPVEVDEGSVARSEYLLKRHDGPAENGYADYKRAEETLEEMTPRRMSRLTERLLGTIDFEALRVRRNDNFVFLHEKLGKLNRLALDPQHVDGPLCYPLQLDQPGARERLRQHRVFVPTYWPEVRNRAAAGDFELQLVDQCLPIPCDQRYERPDLEIIVKVLLG